MEFCYRSEKAVLLIQHYVVLPLYCHYAIHVARRSQWPRGPKHRSAATRLLRFWNRMAPGAWMSVLCFQVEVFATG
jgi:hypothetical protein